MRAFLVGALLFSFVGVAFPQQTSVRSITLVFATRQNAKPWNAEVRANIKCAGQTMATLQCCSGDKNRDQWAAGSSHLRNMQMAQPLPRVALTGCTLELGMDAPTGTRWTVSPTVQVLFANSARKVRSFDDTTLVSTGGYTAKSFGLNF